jgi:ethanolamine transporter
MSINEGIVYIMVIFAAIGAVDRIFGSRLGFGTQFEEGILSIGSLAISMVGMIALAPVLADWLRPVVVPVYQFLGADPAMFAGTILANDMGGAPLADALATSAEAGAFGGLIVGAMMGPTIVFTIPVGLGIIEEADRPYLARGVLAGVVTIPVGAFVGGLVAGYPVLFLIRNLIPIILIAALIVAGLMLAPDGMIRGFIIFGKIVVGIITVGLILGIIEELTGFVILPGMSPISEGYAIVAEISIVLAGAFPLVHFITKIFRRPLLKAGELLKINDTAAAGLIASLANSIPMFGMMKDMDEKGKIVNVAFAVSAAFVFGDHLGFTAGYDSTMITPMIIAKLTGGITSIPVALFIAEKNKV